MTRTNYSKQVQQTIAAHNKFNRLKNSINLNVLDLLIVLNFEERNKLINLINVLNLLDLLDLLNALCFKQMIILTKKIMN